MTKDEGLERLSAENRVLPEAIEVMEYPHMQMSDLQDNGDHAIVH